MGISLRPQHMKRYTDIARLLFRYGRSDLVQNAGLEAAMSDDESDDAPEPSDAAELAGDLERMGPTYVKLGQLLSTRADLLPLPYLEALARLQDRVEAFPFEAVEEIVQTELGVRLSKAFASFDPKPLAAASLGQVHHAALRDGRPVAVKVQRPAIRQQIVEDLAVLEEIADFLDRRTDWGRRYGFVGLFDEFRKMLLRELDYRQEAANLVSLGKNLAEYERIIVPQPVDDYTTERVLTMDFVRGKKVTALGPLGRLEMDGEPLADELFKAYLQQTLVDGLFHADPHPGNVFLTEDGRIALIDLGMVGRISPEMQEKILRLLLAVSEGRGDEATEVAIRMGEVDRETFDQGKFRRQVVELVGQHQHATMGEIEVGAVVLEISRASADNGIRLPRELAMLAKALLNLDAVGRALAPKFDPNEAIRRHAAEITSRRMRKQMSPGNVFASVLEMTEFAQKLPSRVNRILDALANNELQVKVEAIDEGLLIEGFQKVANRITMGLILGALIVGAAMLMRVETDFRILGYPGLAILCFLGAGAGGVALLIDIWRHDRTRRER
ncbi:MAG: AarF/ABC1/UbiB kinase family protein [Gemmatimonadetes bacterium]|nr:AarF/ABC1/UbiB kinase family protein [Gemmatimonadota bacterium]